MLGIAIDIMMVGRYNCSLFSLPHSNSFLLLTVWESLCQD